MSRCDAELCVYWTGEGCACVVFGIERESEEESTEDSNENEEPDHAWT